MTKQVSFTKQEHKVMPNFRQMIGQAESTADVRKFFVYTVRELFDNVFQGNLDFHYEDVELKPEIVPPYTISQRLFAREDFTSAWKDSDLPRVVDRLAESAVGRYKRLAKNPEKTDAKIRM